MHPVQELLRGKGTLVTIILVVLFAHLGSFTYLSHLAPGDPAAAPYPLLKGDSATYAALADSVLSAGGLHGSAFEEERHWPPGYPIFLAATKWVTGNWYLAIALQIIAVLAAVALIYKIALRFVRPSLAAVSALLFGLDPNVVLADTTILSDGLFGSLLVVAVYVAFFFGMRRESIRWGIVALLLCASALIRPIGQFLVPLAPLALAFVLYLRGARDFRRYVLPVAVYILVAFLVLAPWLVRMHSRHGVYEISHVAASNLLNYNARDFLTWKEMNTERFVPAILASRYRADQAYSRVDVRIAQLLAQATPAGEDTSDYAGAVAFRIIGEDPLRYAYFHLVNTAPFFLGSSIAAYGQVVHQVRDDEGYYAPTSLALLESVRAARSGDLRELARNAPIAAEIFIWAVLCALALVGAWQGWRDVRILALLALVIYFAVLTGPVSIVRYRIPAEPYILILAAVGASVIYGQMIKKRHERTLLP